MKKQILTSMAIVCFATSALAEAVPPTLKMGGNTIMNIYGVSQKFHKNGRARAHHFSNDVSDLYFLIAGKTSSGIDYKYKINMEAISNASPTITQNYVEFNTTAGTFQFGNLVGIEDSFVKDGGSIIGATGGFDGGYSGVFNVSTLSPRGNDTIGDTGYATKFVYVSPELLNIKFGVSYTPDTTHLGDAAMNNDSLKSNPRAPGQRAFFLKTEKGINSIGLNSWAFGLMFHKQFNNWDVNVNAVYLMDQSYLLSSNKAISKLRMHNTSAYQLGTVIGYKLQNGALVQLGGGYLNSGKSRLTHAPLGANATNYGYTIANGDGNQCRGNAGQAWNVAAGFTMGAYKVAGSFQQATRKTDAIHKARNNVYSITGDVVPVGGLKFYTELDYIESKSNQTAFDLAKANNGTSLSNLPNKNNKGFVMTVGTKISF